MAAKEGMHTFAARLASFDEERHGGKRRASSTKKKPASTRVWPHETPTPEQLAKAGFFYNPTPDSSDSVTCYICDKALNGWDPEDDPVLEHFSHVPECGWAINLRIERAIQNEDLALEDPLSDELVAARTTTFGDLWPHAGKRGWKCTVAKMVNAGWALDPVPGGGDDCVKCFYCGISLDGWEPKDDPMDEHFRRAVHCKFFALKDQFASQRKTTKTKRSRTSRVSKASRLSTQSNMTVTSEAPSFTLLDGEAEEGDTMLTAASTISKAAKGRKAASKAKTASKGRKGTRQQPAAEDPAEDEVKDPVDDEAAVPTPPESPVEKPKRKAVAKGKKSKVSTQPAPAVDDSEVVAPRKNARAASKKKADASAVDAMDEEIDMSGLPEKQAQRPKRGVKRTSDGTAKTETSLVLEHSAREPEISQVDEPEPQPKPKAKAKGKAKVSTAVQDTVDVGEADEPEPEPEPEPKHKPKPKRQPKKASIQPVELATEPAQEPEVPKKAKASKAKSKAAPIEILDEASQSDTEPEPPAKSSTVVRSQASQKSINAPIKTKASPPVSSPQSSDAENHLPSSRISLASRPSLTAFPEPPSARKPTVAAPAPPTFAALISTPPQSPSKRNLITKGITSTLPWTAIDLDKVFPLSPSSEADAQAALVNLLPHGHPELLTSPEKRMTVEEWVLWNAANAEERMRHQCERMVKRFEDEGGRAMRVLEGIECV